MVRAPCCEKMGLKRGPWTADEDLTLINYVNLHGHGNWRALPKQAGLLRCGKSCRLRWTNYLRPDIKRGNFSPEEEDTIIKLHEMLGNRWSAIAARLPGRTDNEIKNVWHTHLKKRLIQKQPDAPTNDQAVTEAAEPEQMIKYAHEVSPESPQRSVSSATTTTSTITRNTTANTTTCMNDDMSLDQYQFADMDESFWSDVFSADNSGETSHFPAAGEFPVEHFYSYNSGLHDTMDFWFNTLLLTTTTTTTTTAAELQEFPDF